MISLAEFIIYTHDVRLVQLLVLSKASCVDGNMCSLPTVIYELIYRMKGSNYDAWAQPLVSEGGHLGETEIFTLSDQYLFTYGISCNGDCILIRLK